MTTNFTAVPDKNVGDIFTQAMWATYIEQNLNKGVNRPLADSTLGAPAANIDLTSIDQNFGALLLVVYARVSDAGTVFAVNMRFNGDTGANYDYQYVSGSAATVTAAESLADTAAQAGLAPGSTAGANLYDVSYVVIPNYTGTTNNKAWRFSTLHKSGTASGNLSARSGGGGWRSTAAISRITLLSSGGGNLMDGSRATLYGLAH